jgi:hypothetical protein
MLDLAGEEGQKDLIALPEEIAHKACDPADETN